jgi:hypothetical protein
MRLGGTCAALWQHRSAGFLDGDTARADAGAGSWIGEIVFGVIMLLAASGLWYELAVRIRQTRRSPAPSRTRPGRAPRPTLP